MSAAKLKFCMECQHWLGATAQNRVGCGKRLKTRYVWPEKMGDEHGLTPADAKAKCFTPRPVGAKFEPVRRRSKFAGQNAERRAA